MDSERTIADVLMEENAALLEEVRQLRKALAQAEAACFWKGDGAKKEELLGQARAVVADEGGNVTVVIVLDGLD